MKIATNPNISQIGWVSIDTLDVSVYGDKVEIVGLQTDNGEDTPIGHAIVIDLETLDQMFVYINRERNG